MKHTIKVRTFLGQAIDTFKEYIKTKGNLQTDYSLEKYMQEILDYIDYLEKENQELKKQLEEINKMIEKCGFVNIEQVMLNYCGLLSPQKEFIKYLEDLIKLKSLNATCMFEYNDTVLPLKEILQKYKSIIGDDE